jgi:hypothetical protein
LEGSDRDLIVMYYPGICLEGLKKITKDPSQYSRSPGRDLNPEHREYEAEVLTTRPRRSVTFVLNLSYWQARIWNYLCRPKWTANSKSRAREILGPQKISVTALYSD